MLNACRAAINEELEEKRYNMCISENIINNANNTDNVLELLTSFIDYIYKRDIMNSGKDNNYFRQMLFNDTIHKLIIKLKI
jgi:hypothetical protein